jgi:predicted nuclease with TOPRIM domain
MADSTNTRLLRIEEKLDKLADAMVSLARAEEKMVGLKDDHQKMYDRVNRLSQKLDEIDRKVEENAHTVHTINKLFWVAIVAITGSIAAQLWM